MAVVSRKVYLAPDMFCSFLDRAHPQHEKASAFFRFFAQEEYQLYSDIDSVMVAYQKMYTDISPSLGKDFLRTLFLSNINLLYPDEMSAKAALKALTTFNSTELTYEKALLCVHAYKRGISQICSFEYLPPLFGLSTFYLPI